MMALVNYRARIKESKYLSETNPIWKIFDDLGFKKLQFVIIPPLYVLVFYFSYTFLNKISAGVILGLFSFNFLHDLMKLHYTQRMKDNGLAHQIEIDDNIKHRVKNIKVSSFKNAFLGLIGTVIFVPLLISFGSYTIIYTIIDIPSVFVLPTFGIFVFLALLLRKIDFVSRVYPQSQPTKGGIPSKTELNKD